MHDDIDPRSYFDNGNNPKDLTFEYNKYDLNVQTQPKSIILYVTRKLGIGINLKRFGFYLG